MKMSRFYAYFALCRQQLLSKLAYRAGLWSKLSTNIFWAYVRCAILIAFYRYGTGEAGLSLSQAVSMVWLQQIALNLLPGFGMDFTVWNKITTGDVGYDLLRPLDIYGHWYANAVAIKLAPFALALVPVTLAALLTPGAWGLRLSVSPLSFLAGLLTLSTGLLVSCAVICLSYAACMDTRVGPVGANIIMTVSQILAGSLLPLQLWPDFLQPFLALQPFSAMMDLPLRFFVGSASLAELPRVLLLQLVWGALIVLVGRCWIGRNLRKLVLQGG